MGKREFTTIVLIIISRLNACCLVVVILLVYLKEGRAGYNSRRSPLVIIISTWCEVQYRRYSFEEGAFNCIMRDARGERTLNKGIIHKIK